MKSIRLNSSIDQHHLALGRRGLAHTARILHHDTWNSMTHEGVPVSLLELVQLVADFLGILVDMDNSHKLLQCHWQLGWHVTSTDHNDTTRHYRGGGVTPTTTSNYQRGDWVETNVSDVHSGVRTSRLARIVCGVRISGVRRIMRSDFPDETWETLENKRSDTLFFLLVRYASPHRNSGRRRGPQNRPLCPGILRDTHCLWSWTKRRVNFQRGCLSGNHWERNRHLFGHDIDSQLKRRDSEQRAWYDLIQVHDIKCYANVQIDPDRDEAFLQSVMWC